MVQDLLAGCDAAPLPAGLVATLSGAGPGPHRSVADGVDDLGAPAPARRGRVRWRLSPRPLHVGVAAVVGEAPHRVHGRDFGPSVPGRLARRRDAAAFRVQGRDDPGVVVAEVGGGARGQCGVREREGAEEAEGEDDVVLEGEGEGCRRRQRRQSGG